MTTRISLFMILLGAFLLLGFSAHASNNSSEDDTNQQFVEHLNYYYGDLKLKVQPGGDPDSVYLELRELEKFQYYKSTTSKMSPIPRELEHLTCNGGPCGPCSRGAC